MKNDNAEARKLIEEIDRCLRNVNYTSSFTDFRDIADGWISIRLSLKKIKEQVLIAEKRYALTMGKTL